MERKTRRQADETDATGADKPTTETPKGVDALSVLREVLGEEFDPHRIAVFNLAFGVRTTRFQGKEVGQVVSVLDLGGGKSRDVFPILHRFRPPETKSVRCYVVPREVPERRKGQIVMRGDKPVMRHIGHAIPIDLLKAIREGWWLLAGNNHIEVTFWEKDSERQPGVKEYLAFGPNGKLVVAATGFIPTPGKIKVQVVEKANRFEARCMVSPEFEIRPEDTPAEKETKTQALVVQAETIGNVVKAADDYAILIGDHAYDACQIMNLPGNATEAEIKKAKKAMVAVHHPDKKVAEFRELTGTEPTAEDKTDWNFSWSLIERAHNRMLLIAVRNKAASKYRVAGRKADPGLPEQLTVEDLATRLGYKPALVRQAFKSIGYDGVRNKTVVDREIAWVLLGFAKSGALDAMDDMSDVAANTVALSTPAQNGTRLKLVGIEALALAAGKGVKLMGTGEGNLDVQEYLLFLQEQRPEDFARLASEAIQRGGALAAAVTEVVGNS